MDLRSRLIRLAHGNPELQDALLPILKDAQGPQLVGRLAKSAVGHFKEALSTPGPGDDRLEGTMRRVRARDSAVRDLALAIRAAVDLVPQDFKGGEMAWMNREWVQKFESIKRDADVLVRWMNDR